MNRQELQCLSKERLDDARALLAAERWSGAYYMAGYEVECALKACVLAYLETHMDVIFTQRGFQGKCWTHDVETLAGKVGLKYALEATRPDNESLRRNWQVVTHWREDSRYGTKTQQEAKELLAAITDEDGVLSWLKSFW